MEVLLINPLCRLPYMLPVGLGYVAAVLKKQNHNVRILDINAYGYTPEKVEEIISQLKFDVVGIGGLSSTYKYVKWLAEIIKKHKPHIKIVAGNSVASANPELILKNSKVDIAVIDEGEITFSELISAIKNNRDLKEVKGIFYKENNQIISTPLRERICDLDSLPFPTWELFPMEIYINNSLNSSVLFGKRIMSVSSVRGCPYECIFCLHPFGRKVYMRSTENLVDEIKELKKRYEIQFITFSDDLFLLNREWVTEFCDRMISEDMDMGWSAAGRVNLVNNSLLSKMRRAGCVEISYGFESGSQTILDRMKKRVTVKQAEEAIKMSRHAGITVRGSFIFGMLGETRETIKETLEFMKRTRIHVYRFFYATPYPKTELYEIAKRMGRLPADEDKYMESLGEMKSTFLVNLTDFSDEELVRVKNLTELTARRNLGLELVLEEFIERWQIRYIIVQRSIKKSGLFATIQMVFSKIIHKLMKEYFKTSASYGKDKKVF